MLNTSLEANALEPLADIFKLLSDGTRLRILSLLAKGERNVTSLCQDLQLPQPTVSHHLGLLRMRNIISNRRNGKQVFYGLDGQVTVGDGQCLVINSDGYKLRICGPAEAMSTVS
ncbi:ArsR/SmtB family transcription factor [Humisphaera borealis]|uniref:Winged helix-turn-helix transcriptional regulator n=1 Tax=Humisphaera borealis TaxID=2807512 RepID=A0A7M2X2R0_9BACT|nr:metalloregulator ArsR/SmtB family transcription factor [Humisphaera borealis]QOV91321.1 winged helix-turn-helix transcriptional regulator [Humisphaera borealis]